MSDGKKISFGFSKISKKPEFLPRPPEKKKEVELIDCLEGKSIKVKGVKEEEKLPLVIPIVESEQNIITRCRNAQKRKEATVKQEEDNRPDSELTVEELAARELVREAQKRLEATNSLAQSSTLTISQDDFINEGKEESTLEDYENIPISEFGKAMLRGMGWKEGMAIGKNSSKVATVLEPELRPKGLGLGASKMVDKKPGVITDKNGKELILKKGAFAKIIAGSYKGNYVEVLGLDDEAGRVIVKTVKEDILTLNEFTLIPVTKDDYTLGSKVINNAKYEEYKENHHKRAEMKGHEVPIKETDKTKNRSRSVSPENSKHLNSRRKDLKQEKSEFKDESERRYIDEKRKNRKGYSSSDEGTENYGFKDGRHRSKNKSNKSERKDKYESRHKKKSKSKHYSSDSEGERRNHNRHKRSSTSRHGKVT